MPSLDALVREHHKRLLVLEHRAQAGMAAAWDELGGPSDDDLDSFVRHAAPIAAGARRAAVVLMAGYLAAFVSAATRQSTTFPLDVAAIIDQLRGGVPLAELYARPVITLRSALADGRPYLEAAAAARARAVSAVQTDVVLANRAAGTDAMSSDERIVGYSRVLSGNSCELCAVASTQRYRTDELMPIHNNCDCGIAPIIGHRDPGQVINRDLLRDIKTARSDSGRFSIGEDGTIHRPPTAGETTGPAVGIAVHDHGELGPVLTVAGDDFTGPDDLAA